VQTAQQGGYVATPQAVSSGVMLVITPTAMSDGTIRMVVNITDSQFVPTTQNVAVETDQNPANTTMLVADGESIVIGG
jgi:type II secretory pathway component GspD/PulD (secretin)